MKKYILSILSILCALNLNAQCEDNGNYWNDSWVSCTSAQSPNPLRGDTYWLLFDFDEPQIIDTAYFWNANRTGESGWGAKDVAIDYSIDGSTWVELGVYEFPVAPETDTYEGFLGPEFDSVFVEKILITILSTHDGGDCASIAEVQFHIDKSACYGTMDDCGICDGPGATTWYIDADMDGLGDPSNSIEDCEQPQGYVENDGDLCDNGYVGWAEIAPLFSDNGCTGCHGGGAAGGLDLRTYTSTAAGGNICGTDLLTGTKLVDIINISSYDGCGMPISFPSMNARVGNQMDAQELAQLQAWVDGGAPEICIDFCPDFVSEETVSICEGDDYTFPDGTMQNNITTNLIYTSNMTSFGGCDSIISTNLEVQANFDSFLQVVLCSGTDYTFPDGSMQSNITMPITQTSNLQTFTGCDSTIVTDLLVNASYNIFETIEVCSGDAYTFPDGTTWPAINANASYTSDLQTTAGCDSIIQSAIVVLPIYNQMESVSVCNGTSYTFPDGTIENNISVDFNHTSNLTSNQGCDSIIVTSVSVDPDIEFSEMVNICEGNSYTFPDGSVQNNITSNQSYVSTLMGNGTCDTLLTTNLMVQSNWVINEEAQICAGGSFTFPDGTTMTNLSNDQIYTSLLQSTEGCDSVIVTELKVASNYTLVVESQICAGTSYTFPDGTILNNITTAIQQASLLTTVAGCDSLVTTHLEVRSTYAFNESVQICAGASYTFPDGTTMTDITSDQLYHSELISSQGCDSLIVTELAVNSNYTTMLNAQICAGGTYTFPDGTVQNNITTDVQQSSLLTTVAGCDSLVTTDLVVIDAYAINESFQICAGASYTFPDGTTMTNITTDQLYHSELISSQGCDSLIVTELAVNSTYTTMLNAQICAGGTYTFPDGTIQNNIATDVQQSSLLTTVAGCDSLVTTDLVVVDTYMFNESFQICQGESYTFPDGTTQNNITQDLIYNSNLISVDGCDSIVITGLVVELVYEITEEGAICQGEDYTFPDGMTQTDIQSDIVYTSMLHSSDGCDSLVTTELLVTVIDTTVSVLGSTLTANATATTYQWLDCENNFAIIPGATNQTFNALENGRYAVVVTENGCVDTSGCHTVLLVGVDEIEESLYGLKPNPVRETLFLTGEFQQVPTVEVYNVLGQICLVPFNVDDRSLNVDNLASGVYLLKLQVGERVYVLEFVKQW